MGLNETQAENHLQTTYTAFYFYFFTSLNRSNVFFELNLVIGKKKNLSHEAIDLLLVQPH